MAAPQHLTCGCCSLVDAQLAGSLCRVLCVAPWLSMIFITIRMGLGQESTTCLPPAPQHGVDSEAGAQRAQQVAASLRAHAPASREVALFALAAGVLTEEELLELSCAADDDEAGSLLGPGCPQPGQAVDCSQAGRDAAAEEAGPLKPVYLRQDTAKQRCPGSSSPQPNATWLCSREAAAEPLALYHSRRSVGAQAQGGPAASLRAFCHADWHTAYLHSSARQLAAPPDPLACLHR